MGSMLAHGFDPKLFVAIIVAGMFGVISLFIFSTIKRGDSRNRQ